MIPIISKFFQVKWILIFKIFDNAKTKQETDESSGKTKLKNLGLSDDEIKALMGK